MRVVINGGEKHLQEGLTVSGLLNQLDIVQERVAVELNLEIVPRKRFDEIVLKEGDNVEIVSFVGGG